MDALRARRCATALSGGVAAGCRVPPFRAELAEIVMDALVGPLTV